MHTSWLTQWERSLFPGRLSTPNRADAAANGPAVWTGSAPRHTASLGVQLVLGNPKQKCAGVGICRIETAGEQGRPTTADCTRVYASLQLLGERQLLCKLTETHMSDCARRQFAGPCFVMPEPVDASAEVAAGLGLSCPLRIGAGAYPCWQLDGLVYVLLLLCNV